MTRQRVIYATAHDAGYPGSVTHRVVLHQLPIAVVSPIESVIHGWWLQSGGYPVGRIFGTRINSAV